MASLTDLVASVPQSVQWALAGVGALYLGSKALNCFSLILNVFLLSGTSLRKYGKPGTWAVVTGASDGLGKEFAYQLASKGFNLVLVSRTKSKLDTLAKDLEEKFTGKGFQVKTLAMDFSRDDAADYEKLTELVSDLDVGILINNVGQSHSIPVTFLDTPREEVQDIVTINCLGTLKTTQIVAPILKRRKKGLILTMGSFAGWMPTPYLATYAGSKAFLQHWSSSVASELQGSGVDVELCLSYLITTAMSKIRRSNILIPNPRNFVRSALGKLGCGGFQVASSMYTPWWSHAVFLWFVESTVGASNWFAIWYNKKMHIDIRTRALRKAAREAKRA